MSKQISEFGSVIQRANTGATVEAVKLINKSPETAAVLSKLVKNNVNQTRNDSNLLTNAPGAFSQFQKSSNNVATNIRDAQTVKQMLPDMELPQTILVSSIISPKDMMSTELTYSSTCDEIPPNVMASLIDTAKKYFEEDYKIIPLLPKILKTILFEKGSYPIAVIPENAIDDIINNIGNKAASISLETFQHSFSKEGEIKNIGILGPSTVNDADTQHAQSKLGLENYSREINKEYKTAISGRDKNNAELNLNLGITDNPDILKLPEIKQVLRERRIMSAIKSPSMEAFNNRLTDIGLTNTIYKNSRQGYTPIVSVKTNDQLNRKSVGNPLILSLPPESVINIFVPGNPEKHIAHIVMLDQTGNPISTSNQINLYSELSSSRNSTATSLLQQARAAYGLAENELTIEQQVKYTTQIYSEIVEKDLLSRLKNGVYGEGVEIANNQEIYQIMLARTLSQKYTQLLLIPGEQMTYMAFKYNADGTGKSLMDDLKLINSLRVALLLSDVHSSLRNSIGATNIEFKLDEDDPNPQKTIEEGLTEIVRARSNLLPLGMNDPSDIVNHLQRASFQVSFTGHPGLPDVGLTTSQVNTSYVKPDTDLSEDLRKQTIMGMSLNPSVVDASYEAEFATAITNNNLLLAKNVQQYQDMFTPQLSDNLRKIMMHSQSVNDKLRKIIESNLGDIVERIKQNDDTFVLDDKNKLVLIDTILVNFITTFNVSLPSPNTTTLRNQMDALKEYKEALELAIDAWISDTWLTTETMGEVANQVNVIKGIITSFYLRKYMAENGILTELAELTMVNEQGKPEMDFYEDNLKHIESLSVTLSSLMGGLKPIKERGDKVGEALGGVEESSGGSDDTGNTESDNPEGGDELDGMDLGDDSLEDTGETPTDTDNEEKAIEDTPAKEEDKDKPSDDTQEEKKEPNLNGEVPK